MKDQEDEEDQEDVVVMKNKKGETRAHTQDRGEREHPDKTVVLEDPDAPPPFADDDPDAHNVHHHSHNSHGSHVKTKAKKTGRISPKLPIHREGNIWRQR
jgi:hypothetical protein